MRRSSMCRVAAIRWKCATGKSSSTKKTTRPTRWSRTRSSPRWTSCGATRAGDILVFLSGEREIRETAESLRKHHPQGCEILPLYSRLAQEEQQRVFRPVGPAPHRARHQRGRDIAHRARHPRGDRHRRGAHQPLQPSQPPAAAAHREDLAGHRPTSAPGAAVAWDRASPSACTPRRISSRARPSPSRRSSAPTSRPSSCRCMR